MIWLGRRHDHSGGRVRDRPGGRRGGNAACRASAPSGITPLGDQAAACRIYHGGSTARSGRDLSPVLGESALVHLPTDIEAHSSDSLRAVFAGIPLDVPWTLDEFGHWFGAVTGMEVHLAPWRVESTTPPKAAMLMVVDGRVIVRYDGRRSPRHQWQQIGHEFAHVLCDLSENRFAVGPGLFSQGFDLAKIGAVMQRQTLDSENEIEAEVVGTHLALMSREVRQLMPTAMRRFPDGLTGRYARRRVRALACLWRTLTTLAPEVRLCDALSLRSPIIAAHRMFVEIEDAVMALAPMLRPPTDGAVDGWVLSLSDLMMRGELRTAVTSFAPNWPRDERAVVGIARAWRRHCGDNSLST